MDTVLNRDIPVVIPSYQPGEPLLTLCGELQKIGLSNVLIVDDGSEKSYQKYFSESERLFGVTVLHHEKNRGKGRALKTAFSYLLKQDGILGCVTADSDGQHLPEDILRCTEALRASPSALILGCRDFSGENVPNKSRFGNNLTKKVFSYLCGIQISDTQTGLRGIPAGFMKTLLEVGGERFEFETNMLIACRDTVEIREIPIETVYDSKENHQTHFNPVVDSLKIYWLFAKIFLRYIFASLSSSVIDVVLFTLFCTLTRSALPVLYLAVSTVLARIISASYNWCINYFLVFRGKKSKGKSIARYFLLALCQMLASALLVTGLSFLTRYLISDTVLKILVDLVIFFVNYHIQLKFVY